MDAYNRGYGAGIGDTTFGLGETGLVGGARITARPNSVDYSGWQTAGFYAISYEVEDGADIAGLDTGDTIISYRGTDASALAAFFGVPGGIDGVGDDALTGFPVALGAYAADQAQLAAEFYQSVTGTETGDPRTGNAILTGHSLGGGLAGFVVAA